MFDFCFGLISGSRSVRLTTFNHHVDGFKSNLVDTCKILSSFIVLALLRARFAGYTVPYMVFAVIALIGGVIILATKVKGAVGHILEEQQ